MISRRTFALLLLHVPYVCANKQILEYKKLFVCVCVWFQLVPLLLTLEGGTNSREWDLHKSLGLTEEVGTNIRG